MNLFIVLPLYHLFLLELLFRIICFLFLVVHVKLVQFNLYIMKYQHWKEFVYRESLLLNFLLNWQSYKVFLNPLILVIFYICTNYLLIFMIWYYVQVYINSIRFIIEGSQLTFVKENGLSSYSHLFQLQQSLPLSSLLPPLLSLFSHLIHLSSIFYGSLIQIYFRIFFLLLHRSITFFFNVVTISLMILYLLLINWNSFSLPFN